MRKEEIKTLRAALANELVVFAPKDGQIEEVIVVEETAGGNGEDFATLYSGTPVLLSEAPITDFGIVTRLPQDLEDGDATGKTAANSMLAWNPGTDQVAIGPWPDHTGWAKQYRMTGFAAYTRFREMGFEERKKMVFIEAMHLIVRDGVDPQAVHRAFLELEEYRDGCSDDVPGIRRL